MQTDWDSVNPATDASKETKEKKVEGVKVTYNDRETPKKLSKAHRDERKAITDQQKLDTTLHD